jgi:hypothetical protein
VTIEKTTAKCKYVAMGSYPNSLSIVPVGTVSATDETLVGYLGADYVKIDKKTGAIAKIGSLGGGYTSSGDVVSVIGGGTYLTVKGNSCSDCVVRVDPATGALVEVLGPSGYTDVFGVAFWAGVVYGFTSAGQVFAYDVATKSSKPVALPGAPKNLSFYGAGSTTCAPATPTPG